MTYQRWIIIIVFLFSGALIGCGSQAAPLTIQETVNREQKIQSLMKHSVKQLRVGTAIALDEAYAALELARELDESDPRIIDGLGCVAYRQQAYQLAEYYFKRALELNPNYDRAYAHLAMVAEKRGDYQAAKELLMVAVNMNPLNYRSRNNYAVVLLRHGNKTSNDREGYEELLKSLKSSEKVDPVIGYNLTQFEER